MKGDRVQLLIYRYQRKNTCRDNAVQCFPLSLQIFIKRCCHSNSYFCKKQNSYMEIMSINDSFWHCRRCCNAKVNSTKRRALILYFNIKHDGGRQLCYYYFIFIAHRFIFSSINSFYSELISSFIKLPNFYSISWLIAFIAEGIFFMA